MENDPLAVCPMCGDALLVTVGEVARGQATANACRGCMSDVAHEYAVDNEPGRD